MKKTLIALMALAGVAMAETTPTPVLTLSTTTTNTIDLSSYITGNAFTVAVTLDYDTVKNYLLADSGDNQQLINVGTDETLTTGSRIGMTICYGDNSAIRGTWNEATWNNANTSGFQVGMDLGAFDSLSWGSGTVASLVMTYDYNNGTTGVFTIADANGNVLNQIGGAFYQGLRGSNFDPNSLQLHSSVLSASVYNQVMTADQAKSLGASMIIPEPTTATLSLLALAGLAARRRRR